MTAPSWRIRGDTLVTGTMGNSASAREAFDKMDTDKSGELDFEEIKAAVAAMGQDPDDDRIRKYIADHDTDGNGTLDFAEFEGLAAQIAAGPEPPAPPADDAPPAEAGADDAEEEPAPEPAVEELSREDLERLHAEAKRAREGEAANRQRVELEIEALRKAHVKEREAFRAKVREATDARADREAKAAAEKMKAEFAEAEAAKAAARLAAAEREAEEDRAAAARLRAEQRAAALETTTMMGEDDHGQRVARLERHHSELVEAARRDAAARAAREADAEARRALEAAYKAELERAREEADAAAKLTAELEALRLVVKNEGTDDVHAEAQALADELVARADGERARHEGLTRQDAEAALRSELGWSRVKVNEAVTYRSRGAGLSRLHEAALAGRGEEAKLLLAVGADPNALNTTERQTPLHKAALGGHVGLCELLLQGGALLDAKDAAGSTAAEYFRRKGHGELAERLAELH